MIFGLMPFKKKERKKKNKKKRKPDLWQNNRDQHKSAGRICNCANLNQTLESFKRFQELNFREL